MTKIIERVRATFAPFEDFCRGHLDPHVVIDVDGYVAKYNALFCYLVGMTPHQIRKCEPLESFLGFRIGERFLPWRHL